MPEPDPKQIIGGAFSAAAATYDEVIDFFGPFGRALVAGADLQPGERVLDLACGRGSSLFPALDAVGEDGTVIGIDLAQGMVERLTVDLEARGIGNAEVRMGDAEALDLPDGSVDVITCVYLFHELPRNVRRRIARELRRVLAPGGLLVVEDSAQLSDSAVIAPALHAFARDFHEPFFEDYLEDDLATMLGECGFVVSASEPHLVAKVVVASAPSPKSDPARLAADHV